MNKDEYNKKIEEKYGVNTFEVYQSNDDIKNRDRIKVRCKKCGDIREVEARSFIRSIEITGKFQTKRKCKNCRKIADENKPRGLTSPLALSEIEERIKDLFEVISFTNSSRIEVRCKKCGHRYINSLQNLSAAKSCVRCRKRSEKSVEEMQKDLDRKFSPGVYTILSISKSGWKSSPTHKIVTVRYKEKIFKKAFNEILKFGCEREFKRSFEYINQELRIRTKGRYKALSGQTYVSRKANAKFIDTYTGRIEERRIENFLRNPTFYPGRFSKYAIIFFTELNKARVSFMKEKMFSETGRLRFDISTKKDGILIEIDGEQHFSPIFGKEKREETFQKTRKNDSLKNSFVKESGKTLIRVSYKNFNEIESISNIVASIKNLDFESLKSNPNILLIKDGVIFNENSYYEA